jgi:hypothetical protein
MTAELCPTCGLWWRGMEHSCRLPIYSTSTAGLSLADTDPRDAEIARLRAALDGLVAAATAVVSTTDEYRDAVNGVGHEGEPHDQLLCAPGEVWHEQTGHCALCGGKQYGTEDSLDKAMGDLRAALGMTKKPWETRTTAEFDAALATAREVK